LTGAVESGVEAALAGAGEAAVVACNKLLEYSKLLY
jgi:hypothetical protein